MTHTPRRLLAITLATAAILAFLAGTRAVADTADRLGIYFDEDAHMTCTSPAPFNEVTMYVILTDPSFAELHGWEAAIRMHDGGASILVGASVRLGGVNAGTWPEFVVSYPSPVPTSGLMVLAEVTVLPAALMECQVLTGVAAPSLPGTLPVVRPTAVTMLAITNQHYWPNGVAASIGGCGPIPEWDDPCSLVLHDEPLTWGGVKARYR